MEVSTIAAMSSSLAMAKTQDAVSLAVLKEAMQQQGSAVLPLITAATGSVAPDSTLGRNVDVFV